MSVVYRPLRTEETEQALDLWVSVMEKSRSQAEAEFYDYGNDPAPHERTFAAVKEDGMLLAAAQFWIRQLRDEIGQPCRIGHVLHVATRADAQRQGHASRLMPLVIEAMRADGCRWSILFASPQAAPLYAQHGWRGFPNTFWQGSVSATWTPARDARVRIHEPVEGWDVLAPVYERYNRARPLTVVRDAAYWRGYAGWMLNQWTEQFGAVIFTAGHEVFNGYAVVFFSPMGFLIAELGYTVSDALPALLTAVVEHATRQGFPAQGRIYAPAEPSLIAALRKLFGDTLHTVTDAQEQGYMPMMARVVDPAYQDLDAIFHAPARIAWMVDQF